MLVGESLIAYSNKEIRKIDIESGLNTGDALLTTVTVGGAVVGGAIVGLEKVAPKSIKNKMKRQKSYLKKKKRFSLLMRLV